MHTFGLGGRTSGDIEASWGHGRTMVFAGANLCPASINHEIVIKFWFRRRGPSFVRPLSPIGILGQDIFILTFLSGLGSD